MKKESSILGVNGRKLADLLKAGSDSGPTPEDKDHERVDLLHDILNAAIPACLTDEQEPPPGSGAWKRSVEALSGDRIGQLLQDPQADVSFVRRIKDHGRRVSSNPCSQVEHQVGNAVYFAAIAHALVFHDVRITKLSYADLQKSFQSLTGQSWIPRWLIALFEQASTACQAKAT